MATVLITAIGSFAAGVVIANLKRAGHRVVGCDIYPSDWIADSRNVDVFAQAPGTSSEDCYLQFLCKMCAAHSVGYIIPLTDPEVDVLSKNKVSFRDKRVEVCVPDCDVVSLCRDKYALPKRLRSLGVTNTIKTDILDDARETEARAYPLIAKPRRGRSSQGCFIINDLCDLNYVKARHSTPGAYVLQPFIAGKVITVDVIRCPTTGRTVCVSRKELLRTTSGAGTTVEIIRVEALDQLCRRIASGLNITGAVNYEFIESENGEFFLLEINPRFSAGVKFSYMAGYDFISHHLHCFEGKPIAGPGLIRPLIISRKYEEHIMREDNHEETAGITTERKFANE